MKRSLFPSLSLATAQQWLKSLKPAAIWSIPLLSVISVPLALSYWAMGHRDSTDPGLEVAIPPKDPVTASEFPPLSQLPKSVPDSPELLKPVPLSHPVSPLTKPKTSAAVKPTASKTAMTGAPTSSLMAPDPLPPLPKTSLSGRTQTKEVRTKTGKIPATATHSKSTATVHHKQAHTRSKAAVQQAAYVPPPLEIRVGIIRDQSSTTVGTSGRAYLQERTGQTLDQVAANQSLTVVPNGASLMIGGRKMPAVTWLTPAQGSFVYVGDRWYRGRVLLVSKGNSVLAVNYVDLEHYLTSVVGSEMHPTAPTEALKAQAIAARSYALVHMIRPASDWFDLGDNQRWQVYKGLQSEYNTGFGAVGATAGQVLSYKGGVVESLYASTDAIVSSVHKGMGMSQLGAYDLAKQGYNYQQILNRYYPGVGLARVILQQ